VAAAPNKQTIFFRLEAKVEIMGSENTPKQKHRKSQQDLLKGSLEELLGKLREGLEQLAGKLIPSRPQPVPIPVRLPGRR
jgi:hypothetical protein